VTKAWLFHADSRRKSCAKSMVIGETRLVVLMAGAAGAGEGADADAGASTGAAGVSAAAAGVSADAAGARTPAYVDAGYVGVAGAAVLLR
jgi:hypothetical protein